MKKLIATTLATALSATMAISSAAPAAAQSVQFSFGQGDRVIGGYCQNHSRDRDCRDYRNNHSRWSRNDYNNFYGRHRTGLDSFASGAFGFTFGAILGTALANSNSNRANSYNDSDYDTHVANCEARFRSYRESTDDYLGNDGRRHACNL